MRRLNHKIVLVATVAIIAVVVLVGAQAFFSRASTSPYATYEEPSKAVHARAHQTVTAGGVSIRLNGITDARNPGIRDTWVTDNLAGGGVEHGGWVYNFSLTPPPGERYVIANVTVATAQHKALPFTYTNFLAAGRDGHAYYATYAVCDNNCSASVLWTGTLHHDYPYDLYILFAIPDSADVAKLAYVSPSASAVFTTE